MHEYANIITRPQRVDTLPLRIAQGRPTPPTYLPTCAQAMQILDRIPC